MLARADRFARSARGSPEAALCFGRCQILQDAVAHVGVLEHHLQRHSHLHFHGLHTRARGFAEAKQSEKFRCSTVRSCEFSYEIKEPANDHTLVDEDQFALAAYEDILQLGKDACAATAAVQEACAAERTRLLDRVAELREHELDACQAKSDQVENHVGQSIAAAGIAHVWLLRAQYQHADSHPQIVKMSSRIPQLNGTVDLELEYYLLAQASQYLDKVRRIYAVAKAICSDDPVADSPAALAQRNAVRCARLRIDLYTDTHFVLQHVRVRCLVNATQHNCSTGKCLYRHKTPEPACFAVRTPPAAGPRSSCSWKRRIWSSSRARSRPNSRIHASALLLPVQVGK